MKKLLLMVIRLGLTGAILGIAIGYFGHLHPAIDTFSHFRLHLAVGLLVLCALLFALRLRMLAIASLVAGAVGIWGALSGLPISAKTLPPTNNRSIHQMVHFNLFWLNNRKDYVINRIMEIDPLFISLTETSQRWQSSLKRLDERWPHKAHCSEFSTLGGVMLFSKLPMDNSNDFCGDYGSFMKTSVILDNNTRIDLGVVHPRWPWPASGPRQYASFIPTLNGLGDDALIAGDFNAVPWSFALRNFAENGRLNIVTGIGPTWFFREFAGSVARIIGLPIDHVMHKGKVRVLSAKSLDSWGSDHLPVLVNFQIE